MKQEFHLSAHTVSGAVAILSGVFLCIGACLQVFVSPPTLSYFIQSFQQTTLVLLPFLVVVLVASAVVFIKTRAAGDPKRRFIHSLTLAVLCLSLAAIVLPRGSASFLHFLVSQHALLILLVVSTVSTIVSVKTATPSGGFVMPKQWLQVLQYASFLLFLVFLALTILAWGGPYLPFGLSRVFSGVFLTRTQLIAFPVLTILASVVLHYSSPHQERQVPMKTPGAVSTLRSVGFFLEGWLPLVLFFLYASSRRSGADGGMVAMGIIVILIGVGVVWHLVALLWLLFRQGLRNVARPLMVLCLLYGGVFCLAMLR